LGVEARTLNARQHSATWNTAENACALPVRAERSIQQK
jgi:hypothetical protein